ncbi:hypothetical protein FQA47_007669 [Oryzias melastigma]|uniref:Uncharacterized protein n=1 Tax=Oryzias melastigma TaxID=30732 RepID=A0A834F1Z7_ORYME|nr:hypothetical protein FQA47_007669 [Oryzias melastigma]
MTVIILFHLSFTAGEMIRSDHDQILLLILINLKLPIDDVPLTCDQRDPHAVWGRSCLGDAGVVLVLCPAPSVRHAEGRRADCEDAAEPVRCQVTPARVTAGLGRDRGVSLQRPRVSTHTQV